MAKLASIMPCYSSLPDNIPANIRPAIHYEAQKTLLGHSFNRLAWTVIWQRESGRRFDFYSSHAVQLGHAISVVVRILVESPPDKHQVLLDKADVLWDACYALAKRVADPDDKECTESLHALLLSNTEHRLTHFLPLIESHLSHYSARAENDEKFRTETDRRNTSLLDSAQPMAEEQQGNGASGDQEDFITDAFDEVDEAELEEEEVQESPIIPQADDEHGNPDRSGDESDTGPAPKRRRVETEL